MYTYTFCEWLMVFFLYCFLGWCFESTVVSVQQGRFVNRGFLRGPALPIYGFGAILLLHIAIPLKNKPVLLFLFSMLAATLFEYIVGAFMEKIFKVKYWDYSGHRFQFQGLICLQSSACWGVMGLLLSGIIHPPIERLVFGMPAAMLVTADAACIAAFTSDVAISVKAALNLAKLLEELDRLREEGAALRRELEETALVRLTNLSYKVDEMRGELAEKMGEMRGEFEEKMDGAREGFSEKASDARKRVLANLEELQQRFEKETEKLGSVRKSILRGNPTATSPSYNEVLQKLKLRVAGKR